MNPPYRCIRYTPSDTSIATSIFLVPGSILPSTPHSLFSIAESSRSSLGNRLKWLVSNPSSPTHSLTEDHGSTCTSDRTLSGVRDLFFRRLLEFSLGGNYRYHRIQDVGLCRRQGAARERRFLAQHLMDQRLEERNSKQTFVVGLLPREFPLFHSSTCVFCAFLSIWILWTKERN